MCNVRVPLSKKCRHFPLISDVALYHEFFQFTIRNVVELLFYRYFDEINLSTKVWLPE